jgi:hypothetical protein
MFFLELATQNRCSALKLRRWLAQVPVFYINTVPPTKSKREILMAAFQGKFLSSIFVSKGACLLWWPPDQLDGSNPIPGPRHIANKKPDNWTELFLKNTSIAIRIRFQVRDTLKTKDRKTGRNFFLKNTHLSCQLLLGSDSESATH